MNHVLAAAFLLLGAGGELEELASRPVTVAKGARTPWAAFGAEGGLFVVFFDDKRKDVLLAVSRNGGGSFSEPSLAIATGGRGHAGMQRGPRVAVDGRGDIYVSACFKIEAGDERSPGSDVCLAVSRDGGKSFGKPVRVNDVARSAPEMYHALAVTASGEPSLAWLDLRRAPELGQVVYSARLTRDGAGELAPARNVEVYVSPKKSVCECCALSIAVDRSGNAAIAFRNSLPDGSRDTFLALSRDRGASFLPAARVGLGSWKTPG